MTGRVKSLLAGCVVAAVLIADRVEQARLNRARAVKAKHWDEIAAQNRANPHSACPICLAAPIVGHVTARLGKAIDQLATRVVL